MTLLKIKSPLLGVGLLKMKGPLLGVASHLQPTQHPNLLQRYNIILTTLVHKSIIFNSIYKKIQFLITQYHNY